MFSGLTNQVSSWMGAAKGEPHDEEVPTPTKDALEGAAADGEKSQSPTKTGSKLDMFTNVKSHVSGWLPTSIPIPGLKKHDAPSEAESQPIENVEPVPESSSSAQDPAKDEDDNSSATGGADSGPASPSGTPTDENAGQIGAVTHKAVAGAKSFGSFLYSAVNKAGAKVSEAGAKIKKTVEENSLLGEFNKEQDAFIRNQSGSKGPVDLPWAGRADEAALKEECLSLSTDRRNFVRAPPAGVEFNFDYDVAYPVAVAIMAEDPNLEKMRFDLVPKVITEENFWRNYFYRVSLICQASEASDANNESQPGSRLASVDEPQDEDSSNQKDVKKSSKDLIKSEQSVAKVEKDLSDLDIDKKNNKEEEEWETELEAELRDYEVLAGDKVTSNDDKQWEKECEDILANEDDEDLK